jgi:hypothetical protein
MKLTSIDLYSNDVSVATFSFRDPGSQNPYTAKSIDGLDADVIVPKFYGYNAASTKKFYDLTLGQRDITITIALNPDFSVLKTYSELRDDLYKVISSSRTGIVQLRFKNGATTIAAISGFVTKFESPQFAQTPEVKLTIRCDDPMLKSLTPVSVSPLLLDTSFQITDIDSTAPHGFQFQLTFNADTLSFVMQDAVVPEWAFTITPGVIGANTGFKNNDILYFSSENGNKQLYLIRAATAIYIVDKIAIGSTWPVLFPGTNPFEITSGAFTWDALTYYKTYWGV